MGKPWLREKSIEKVCWYGKALGGGMLGDGGDGAGAFGGLPDVISLLACLSVCCMGKSDMETCDMTNT
jgi:hypothetical protein